MAKNTTNVRTLSETELDIVVGGVRDNPDQDAQNQRAANANRGDGTLGGTLYGGGYGVFTYGGHPVGF
jgi:hypothetical protein